MVESFFERNSHSILYDGLMVESLNGIHIESYLRV